MTERGPSGDRVLIIAYLWASCGTGPMKLSPEEALAYTRLFFGEAPICGDDPLGDGGFGPAW